MCQSQKILCPLKKRSIVAEKNSILLPKLFWHIVRKSSSSDWEKLLKFEAEGQEFGLGCYSMYTVYCKCVEIARTI